MALVLVKCPSCQESEVVKRGTIDQKKQRYLCKNSACPKQSFLLNYSYQGALPQVKSQILEMALNGSGIRDTARVLKISTDTVIAELKKKDHVTPINESKLKQSTSSQALLFRQPLEVEGDEMWSYVGKKKQQRWLWWPIDHATGEPLAYVFSSLQKTKKAACSLWN